MVWVKRWGSVSQGTMPASIANLKKLFVVCVYVLHEDSEPTRNDVNFLIKLRNENMERS